MTRPTTLAAWLAYLETLHPKAVAMGLDRVRAVHARMVAALACPTVTVTGTNGKGSTCALLEAMLLRAGYSVALYTSPHLLRYNERIRIDGVAVADDDLVAAFGVVEDARTMASPATSLTYFEFGTLAALHLFARAAPDIAILEVGLGGRLDAVNIVDADVAVVTSVDLDHMDFLGPTREDIAREKAGVFRPARPVVCAEPDPPSALLAHAESVGAPITQLGRDFGYRDDGAQWQYWGPGGKRFGLPHPALRGAYQLANAASALAVIDLLRPGFVVAGGAVRDGLCAVELPGRFQVLPGRPVVVLDVAHNPHAARRLADTLGAMGFHPRTLAVFGMLADKDVAGVAAVMAPRIDRWHVAPLPGPRGADARLLQAMLERAGVAADSIRVFDDVAGAMRAAREAVSEADRIVVFGSFLTVAAAMSAMHARNGTTHRHG